MKLLIIDNRQALFDCRQQWNNVARERAFFSWEWNVSWFRQMAQAQDIPWVIVGVNDNGDWESIAPFYINGRKLRLLGSGTACTDYTNLFTCGDDVTPFADQVAGYLSENVGGTGKLQQIDLVEMEGGGGQDQDLNYFCDTLISAGFTSHQRETEGTWRLVLPDTVDGLNAILNSQCRRKVRKAKKRLASADVEVVFAEEANFEQVWSDFVLLHQSRREQLGQAGCFADANFEAFLKQAAMRLIASDQSALFVIYKSGRPLATQLLLQGDDRCMMYQSGAAPEFLSDEPGFQAIVVALEHAIGRKAKVYDFLRGDEDYKSKWSTTREPIIHRRFVPRKLSARVKHRSWLAARYVKHVVASLL